MYDDNDYLEEEKLLLDGKSIELRGIVASGGNSIVYRCKYLNRHYIIKFFKGRNKKRYERFKLEVSKVNYLNDNIQDYAPKIIGYHFPKYNFRIFAKFNTLTAPFYIMEEGSKYIYEELNFEQKLTDIIEICNKLIKMHGLNVYHRDIKPENIIRYKDKLTYIDYGTACVPNIETIDDREPMGSRGTIAPEMINHAYGLSGYKYEYADIYSLGKTMWIILTNDRNAHKFTTYESNNINSKIKLQGVHEGVVMALEQIIAGATRENYLERMTLEKILESLLIIRDGLLFNENNCNRMKFKCLLENISNSKYDSITISSDSKKIEFVKRITNLGIKLSLKESDISLCDSIEDFNFSIEHDSNNNYYFVRNDIYFIFKIKEIIVDENKIYIKTMELSELISSEDSKYFKNIDSFSKKSILSNPIDEITKNIYLECDIQLEVAP